MIVALELLTDRAEDPSEVRDVNVALVPLGTPLLACPGAIVATIEYRNAAPLPTATRLFMSGTP